MLVTHGVKLNALCLHMRRWGWGTRVSSTGYNKSPIKHKCVGKNPQAQSKNKVKMVFFSCLFSLVNGFLIPLSAVLVNMRRDRSPEPGILGADVSSAPWERCLGLGVCTWDLCEYGTHVHIQGLSVHGTHHSYLQGDPEKPKFFPGHFFLLPGSLGRLCLNVTLHGMWRREKWCRPCHQGLSDVRKPRMHQQTQPVLGAQCGRSVWTLLGTGKCCLLRQSLCPSGG